MTSGHHHRDTFIIFTAALDLTARKWAQPACPPTDEQTMKMGYIYTGILSDIRKNEIYRKMDESRN